MSSTAFADYSTIASAIGGAVSAFLATVLVLRRRLSRDSTEITKDRAEASLISRLQGERDQAREEARQAREQRTGDAQAIARLTAENEHLRGDVERMTTDIRRLVRGLSREARQVLATDFAGFNDAPER